MKIENRDFFHNHILYNKTFNGLLEEGECYVDPTKGHWIIQFDIKRVNLYKVMEALTSLLIQTNQFNYELTIGEFPIDNEDPNDTAKDYAYIQLDLQPQN